MANIELPLFPFGSAKIKFLPGLSGLSSDLHDISLRKSKLIDKSFIYNSIPCIWEIRSGLTRRQYTLYKYVGRDRIEVGQFEQAGNRLDGVLSLNASEIKIEVGILTFLVALKGK
jgi:hypothetical protein